MTNHTTDGTVVHSIVGIRIEERRLQNSGREANLVGSGIVISIDGLRCHVPLRLVNGLIHLTVQLIEGTPLSDISQILIERQTLVDLQSAIVLPLVGITYLNNKVLELVLSLGLGLGTHPRSLVNALCQGCLQVVHQVEHTLLARCWEILLDIEFADGLTHDAAHQTDGTLPAGTVLLGTTHHRTQLKGLSTEIIAQLTAGTGHDLNLSICLQIVEGSLCQNLLHLMDGLRLTHVNQVESGESGDQEKVAPVNARIVEHQLVIGHLVIVGINVTQFHAALTGLGDTCLDSHHGLHLLLSYGLIITHHLEEVGHIGLVGLTDTHGLLVIVQIVVLRAQTESPLPYAHEVHRGIAHVGADTYAKHHCLLTLTVELCRHQLVFATVLDGCDLL